MQARIRQPVICVLGHVDAGKTSLLDKIRGSAVALREPDSMTQHIGASFFPLSTLMEICGPVLQILKIDIDIPGLLVIDTPGHSVFANLRRRGGSVADMAILVVDIVRGFEMQTHESINILKNRKTPFLVAANKVDTIPGWKKQQDTSFMTSLRKQDSAVVRQLDDHIYSLMGTLSRLQFRSERFDRVSDFTREIAVVPVSAKTGEGIPELLMVLIGLTQQYMRKRLLLSEGPAKGTVLEVKEEPGLGMTVNAIIYDGVLHSGDTIVLTGRDSPIVTKVRAILLPKPLDEIRDPHDRFTPVEEVTAAAGVKISAPLLDDAMSGGPLFAASGEASLDDLIQRISEEVSHVKIQTDKVGVVVKADTLGSLEATVSELEANGISVRLADVGNVSKRDVVEAATVLKESPLQGVLLAFNVRVLPDAKNEAEQSGVKVFESDVIYRLVQEYNSWLKVEQEELARKTLESLTRPGKIQVLRGFVFRRSKPAIFGVEVLAGRIKPRVILVNQKGNSVGEIGQVQDKGALLDEAKTGSKVAVSMRDTVFGRDFDEGDTLHVLVPEQQYRDLLGKYSSLVSQDEHDLLRELKDIMRNHSPLWGF